MILILTLVLLIGFLVWLWSSFSPPEQDPLDPREGYRDYEDPEHRP